MLELVELPGFERRKPTQISGGQAQRVALARALINRPAVLLLDEPLGALDLKLRKQMQVELKRIQQEVGITFIYVTHDQEEAMTMSDRIAVMNQGRYEQLGDPESLYERPTTRFVAGFLGVSNLLPGAIRGHGRRYATVRLADETRVRAPSALVGGHRRRSSVGVRPEKIRLRDPPTRSPDGQNQLLGSSATPRTSASAPSTSSRRSGAARLTVYEQNVERATRAELWAPGEEVLLTWSPDHTFVVAERPEPTPPASRPDAAATTGRGGAPMTDDQTRIRSRPHPAPLPAGLGPRRHGRLPRRVRHARGRQLGAGRLALGGSAAPPPSASASAAAGGHAGHERRPPVRELDRLHRHRRGRRVVSRRSRSSRRRPASR